MEPEAALSKRKSLRLPHYDYAKPGSYFVTICAARGRNLFGEIVQEEMKRNPAGEAVDYWWNELPKKYMFVNIDVSVIMPNHFHGIISIIDVGADRCVRPDSIGRSHRSAPTLGDIIKWFKTMTTNAYIRGVKEDRWTRFSNSVWQRGYYEHIIRNEKELDKIRQYVIENPARWAFDRENQMAELYKSGSSEQEMDIILGFNNMGCKCTE